MTHHVKPVWSNFLYRDPLPLCALGVGHSHAALLANRYSRLDTTNQIGSANLLRNRTKTGRLSVTRLWNYARNQPGFAVGFCARWLIRLIPKEAPSDRCCKSNNRSL